MPALSGEPWLGAATISTVSGGNGRQFSAIIVTSGGAEPAHPTGSQSVGLGDPGTAYTLWLKWSSSGTPTLQTPNKLEIRCLLPAGDLTTDLLGSAVTVTIGDNGSTSMAIHLDDNPLNGTLGSLRSGAFEIYLKVIKDNNISTVNYTMDTRGAVTGAAGIVVANTARGYGQSYLVLSSVAISTASLGGASATKLAYADSIFARATFTAQTYRSIPMYGEFSQITVNSPLWAADSSHIFGFVTDSLVDTSGSTRSLFATRGTNGWNYSVENNFRVSNCRSLWGTSSTDVWGCFSTDSAVPRTGRFNGTSWSIVDSPQYIANCVHGSSSNDVWTVGQEIKRWNGSVWSIIPNSTSLFTGYGVFALSSNDIWIVGQSSTSPAVIIHWNGTALSDSLVTNATDNFNSVWGASSNDVWAVGNNGKIFHWNGSTWTASTSNVTYTLQSIHGISSTEIWIAGDNGTVLRWNGSVWSVVSTITTGTIWNIVVLSSTDVYIRTSLAIYHYDGVEWKIDIQSAQRSSVTASSTSVTRDYSWTTATGSTAVMLGDFGKGNAVFTFRDDSGVSFKGFEYKFKEINSSYLAYSIKVVSSILIDPSISFFSLTRTSTAPVVNYGIHSIAGTFELVNSRNEKLNSTTNGTYATAIVKTRDRTNAYIQKTISAALAPNSAGLYTLPSFTFTGPTLTTDRDWATNTANDTASHDSSGLAKTLYVILGNSAGVASANQPSATGPSTLVSLSSLYNLDVHPQKTSTLNQSTETTKFIIALDTAYLYASVMDVTGVGVSNVRTDLFYLDPENNVQKSATDRTTSNSAPNVGWVTNGLELQPNTLVGNWVGRAQVDVNYSGASGNYGNSSTGTLDQLIAFKTPYTQNRDICIHAPGIAGVADTVTVMIEFLNQDGTRVTFDTAPSLRIYKLDSTTGTQTDDLALGVMTQVGSVQVYKRTWTPTTSGVFMIEIRGLVDGAGVEKTQRVTAMPRYAVVNGALFPRLD